MSQRSVSLLVVCFALVACVFCLAARASAPSPGANTGRLIEMRLTANPSNYNGACPVTIKFGGFITVCCGPNTVSYGVSGPTADMATEECTGSIARGHGAHPN